MESNFYDSLYLGKFDLTKSHLSIEDITNDLRINTRLENVIHYQHAARLANSEFGTAFVITLGNIDSVGSDGEPRYQITISGGQNRDYSKFWSSYNGIKAERERLGIPRKN